MNYRQVTFRTTDAAQQEILIALLEDIGYEGFEEKDHELVATIPEAQYEAIALAEIAANAGVSFTEEIIAPQNWNAIWEAGFEPVVVDDFCTVRASFHQPATTTRHEVIITPKMSFGTGHHATTRLMIGAMRSIDFENKSVLDFGTGTGILAILAAKLGAAHVTAIDNDEWSISNAAENAAMNGATLKLFQGSLDDEGTGKYDVILANINRNILLQYMMTMGNFVNKNGVLLLSGILDEDEPAIIAAAETAGFVQPASHHSSGWMCIGLTKL